MTQFYFNLNFDCFHFRLICAVGLMFICGEIQLCVGEIMQCHFIELKYNLAGFLYSCEVNSLDNQNNNMSITGSTGNHTTDKNNENVKGIYIHNTNTKYIPKNLGCLFNLTELLMQNTELIEIKSIDFHGMQDLQYLSFYGNKLTTLPTDVFNTLTKLRIINLSHNQIEVLTNGLFDHNLNLDGIWIHFNTIRFIESGLFDRLLKLDYVNLDGNVCLSKRYFRVTFNKLKADIGSNCTNPNEVSATTTTTQNSMEKQRIENGWTTMEISVLGIITLLVMVFMIYFCQIYKRKFSNKDEIEISVIPNGLEQEDELKKDKLEVTKADDKDQLLKCMDIDSD